MCQLLGMNCNTPTDIQFSFEGFAKRGGLTDEHGDGWGIAFFEGNAARCFIDHKPAASSPVAELIRAYPIRSTHVISHIRKATVGEVKLANCHPFIRELWGQAWVFAHNGDLKNYSPSLHGDFLPIGDTDSEQAFCEILQALKQAFGKRTPQNRPALADVERVVRETCTRIAQHGTFNMLLSNGQALFAHCSTKLQYIVREYPFKQAHLIDCDLKVDFGQVTTPQDRVAVIATTALTDDEVWTSFDAGSLLVFQDGQAVIKDGSPVPH
ncbi:MAG TPA: class II glutamine amidotransferase [Limnobacter sp.]|uniref:class II glutamine amidotransferase n=1 Tax=Limnobacter sp. TaxID=2003368 RepID=UPI002EDB9641